MWYVYFLGLRNSDVYVGSRNDLRRRFAEHSRAAVRSTRAHLPARLVAYVGVQDEPTARSLERYFKSGSGKAFATKRFCLPTCPPKRERAGGSPEGAWGGCDNRPE
jgi:predicted GIY-YIG superfamily endonuclease